MSLEFKSKIAGIPCLVSIDYYQPYETAQYSHWHGWISEPVEEDIEYSILDRKGYSARWLEKKMSQEDKGRIYKECFKVIEDFREDY